MKLLMSHEDYIESERDKVKNGTIINGVHVSGLHYFYLNYCQIKGRPMRPLELWDSDLLFFKELEKWEKEIKLNKSLGFIDLRRGRPRTPIFNVEQLQTQLDKLPTYIRPRK